MREQFSRTELLLGSVAMTALERAHVAVFGIGGVGGYAVEALVRSGLGAIDIVDSDVVSVSNINRQIIATYSTVGRSKAEVMAERIRDINPECRVTAHQCFYLPETREQFDFSRYDYIVDAVDTVTAKIALVMEAKRCQVPIISSMGAGNKLDATAFMVADIYATSVCPLARVMRRELKMRNVDSLKVVYSKEIPKVPQENGGECMSLQTEQQDDVRRRSIPGSTAFVPSVAGLVLASEVIKDLTGRQEN